MAARSLTRARQIRGAGLWARESARSNPTLETVVSRLFAQRPIVQRMVTLLLAPCSNHEEDRSPIIPRHVGKSGAKMSKLNIRTAILERNER